MATGGGDDAVFDSYSTQLQATGQFFKDLAEAKRLEAEAQKLLAEADMIRATTEALRMQARIRFQTWLVAINQLQNDLAIMNREARRAERAIEILLNRARRARDLLKGRPINTFDLARAGYKHFEGMALSQGDESLFDMTIPMSSLHADQFVFNNDRNRPIDFPPSNSDPINVLELINWTFDKRYLAKPGTPAQRLFTQLFGRISSVANDAVTRIDNAAAAIRDRTFELWNPASILTVIAGAELTPAEQRVMQNTGATRSLSA